MSLSIVGVTLCACTMQPQPVSSDINVISTQAQNSRNGETINVADIDKNCCNSNFKFTYKGVDIICSAAFDETKFDSNEYEMTQQASCAGQGLDYVYVFKGGSFQVVSHLWMTTRRARLCTLCFAMIQFRQQRAFTSATQLIRLRQFTASLGEKEDAILEYFKGTSFIQFDI